jgi:hypothetical protein
MVCQWESMVGEVGQVKMIRPVGVGGGVWSAPGGVSGSVLELDEKL